MKVPSGQMHLPFSLSSRAQGISCAAGQVDDEQLKQPGNWSKHVKTICVDRWPVRNDISGSGCVNRPSSNFRTRILLQVCFMAVAFLRRSGGSVCICGDPNIGFNWSKRKNALSRQTHFRLLGSFWMFMIAVLRHWQARTYCRHFRGRGTFVPTMFLSVPMPWHRWRTCGGKVLGKYLSPRKTAHSGAWHRGCCAKIGRRFKDDFLQYVVQPKYLGMIPKKVK